MVALIRPLMLNHTGELSGSEHSLLGLLKSLHKCESGSVVERAVLACPPQGELAARAAALGVKVLPVGPYTVGFTRDPNGLVRALADAVVVAGQVARHVRATQPTLLHANSVRAGIVASLGRRLGLYQMPVIVHVRDCVPRNATGRALRLLIHAGATRIVANSAYVARHFALTGGMLAKTRVVYNGVDLSRFDPARLSAADLDARRAELGLGSGVDGPVLVLVGQISPWKGHEAAVRALAQVVTQRPKARLLIVGALKFTQATARYDNAAFRDRLLALIGELGLTEHVVFTGERSDIPELMALSDAVLVPSWEEPFGRTVIEGMAMARPVIATDVGGPAEIIEDGRTGFLVPPHQPEALAKNILRCTSDPEKLGNLRQRACESVVQRFSAEAHAAAMVRVYAEVTKVLLSDPNPRWDRVAGTL